MSELYSGIVEFTDRTFEQALSAVDRPLVVDFYADWCGPCHSLAPVLEQVAADRGHRVTMAKVNLERCPIAARTFAIQSIPTVVILRNGLVKERLVGVHSKEDYLIAIDRALRP